MFFSKPKPLSDDQIENIIGVVLNYRNKFMNIGDVAAANIYTGRQIMELSYDQERLSLEFDAVVVACLVLTLKSGFNIPSKMINSAIDRIFDNTDLPKSEKALYLTRFNDYMLDDLRSIAEQFYLNLPHDNYQDFWQSKATDVFHSQLKMLQKSLTQFIKDESKAISVI